MRLERTLTLATLTVASLLLVSLLLISSCTKTGIDAGVRETKRLHALFDSEWERVMKRFPTRASLLGDRRYNDKWTDNSLQAIEEHHRANRRVLERLRDIVAILDAHCLPRV